LKNADNAFCVQQVAGSNVEERLRRLETEIEYFVKSRITILARISKSAPAGI